MCGSITQILLTLLIILGFAYIIWTLSAKEAQPQKTIGQIISITLVVLAVLAAVLPGNPPMRFRHGNNRLVPPPTLEGSPARTTSQIDGKDNSPQTPEQPITPPKGE